MIEKHQQTNGIGRGKITINPEYIKRAREITVGGQPVKILSSNPNTGRVLAQFPDGHTEEVKAAPDYFIGGNTSTKELKNNQPIYGETNTAANERAASQDEAHDLTPIFSNLITAGQISTMNEGAQDLQNGKYLEGTTKLLSPAMFGSGIGGIAARSGIGGYNLFNKNGVRKTYNLFNQGHYGEGALSLLGDAFNAAMATEGLGSISNALKGTSGYRNWRLAREINKSIKNNKPNIEVPNPTKYNISDNITLYRANPTNIKNPSYKGERYGDTSGQYVGKWFTDEPSKPNWYASNMAKKGEEPAYYQITVPKYWAIKQKASHKISKSNIEYEPEDYIIEDGIQGLQRQLYRGRPGTIQYLQQKFKAPQSKEPSTSLKFFERPQSKISEAERLGVPKGERNFKPKWHVANYPGYQLKGLMKGSQLERQLSKNGTININQLNAYFNKASQVEREVANKVLSEKFAGQKTIDYNQFKKAVQDELINYSTKPQTKYQDYGIDRLGYKSNRHIWEMDQDPNIRIDDGLPVHADTGIPLTQEERSAWLNQDLPRLNTFTFESPRIPVGSNIHYDTTTLGHGRTYTLPEDPHTLYVVENQSDWGQHPIVTRNFTKKYLPTNEEINSHNIRIIDRLEKQVDPKYIDEFQKLKYYAQKVGVDNLETVVDKFSPEFVEYIDKKFPDPFSNWPAQQRLASLRFNKAERSNFKQQSYLHDNYLQRQLQELLKYASENGQTRMMYPTSETAAKIEGYQKTINPKYQELLGKQSELHMELNELQNQEALCKMFNEPFSIKDNLEKTYKVREELKSIQDEIQQIRKNGIEKTYDPKHQTILKKYADFPKLFQKLYKGQNVRTVTDTKGNTWYKVDVPKGYLNREWQFKRGGKMNMLEFLKNGSGIHIKKKNRGNNDYINKILNEIWKKN